MRWIIVILGRRYWIICHFIETKSININTNDGCNDILLLSFDQFQIGDVPHSLIIYHNKEKQHQLNQRPVSRVNGSAIQFTKSIAFGHRAHTRLPLLLLLVIFGSMSTVTCTDYHQLKHFPQSFRCWPILSTN